MPKTARDRASQELDLLARADDALDTRARGDASRRYPRPYEEGGCLVQIQHIEEEEDVMRGPEASCQPKITFGRADW